MAKRFEIQAIFKAIDNMTAPIAKMQSRMKTFTDTAEKGIKQLDTAAGKWLGGMKKVGIGIGAGAAAAAAGLAVAAKPGMEFEQQMANLGATSLQTRDQIQDLEKEALRLGAATQFSATEAAAGMEQMAKAGFSNEEILKGISGMMYAAAAAGEELASTTETVSSVMKGMGLGTSEATRVADVLALASVRTNSSIGSLGESMSKVASTARQLNVPFEDTVAMVALLQDVGIDASEAGTATATMLTMMAKPTDAVAAKMKKMGVSFQDAAGNMKPPAEVLAQLVKAGESAGGNMEQVAFFADLVGMRGQRAAVNLKDLFAAGKVTALTEELQKAEGTAKKMSDLRMATLTGDIDVFTEGIKSLAIELFSMASGPLRGLVKSMTEWIDRNKELIVSGIVDTVKAIADNMSTIVTWAERIGKIVAVITAAAVATKLWAGAVTLLNAVMSLNPISLIAIAVVGAIALIVAFWPEISKFFSDMWEGIVNLTSRIGSAIGGFLSAVFGPIKNFLVGYFEFIVGIWTILIGALMTVLQPVFDWIVGKFTWIYDTLLPIWTAVWDAVAAVASTAWEAISSVITAYVDIVKSVWGTIAGFFSSLWEGIKSIFLKVMDPIFEKIEWAIDKVRSIGRGTLGTEPPVEAGPGTPPQVVGPADRAADRTTQSLSETVTRNESELLIRDTTGKATLTRRAPGITLRPTGAF
jgi:TP901 family phage tail tape measure protein